ncbi:hypothetical protein GCM10007856_00070 [Azospirillum oryzae]|nr:hypothetical protein GCM10007856_00070 [Azospirillum oryzae]
MQASERVLDVRGSYRELRDIACRLTVRQTGGYARRTDPRPANSPHGMGAAPAYRDCGQIEPPGG